MTTMTYNIIILLHMQNLVPLKESGYTRKIVYAPLFPGINFPWE